MYKTWTGSAENADTVARALEAHLNEYAAEVISVAYSVSGGHFVLAVYRVIDGYGALREEEAVAEAEQLVDQKQL